MSIQDSFGAEKILRQDHSTENPVSEIQDDIGAETCFRSRPHGPPKKVFVNSDRHEQLRFLSEPLTGFPPAGFGILTESYGIVADPLNDATGLGEATRISITDCGKPFLEICVREI